MDFKKHLEIAWSTTLKYIAPLIIMTLVMAVVSIVTLGILAPVTMAGYMHAVLLMLREGREPQVKDLFSQMNLFFPLFGFGILVVVAVSIGFMLFVLPGLLLAILLAFATLYMLPLMTDKGLGLIEAIKESFRMSAYKNTLDQIVIVIVFWGLVAVGQAVFIGILFTQPLATVFLLSIYEEKLKNSDLG